MFVEEQKMMDPFQKLDLSCFDGDHITDAWDFLEKCHEILRNLGFIESSGVHFTTI